MHPFGSRATTHLIPQSNSSPGASSSQHTRGTRPRRLLRPRIDAYANLVPKADFDKTHKYKYLTNLSKVF